MSPIRKMIYVAVALAAAFFSCSRDTSSEDPLPEESIAVELSQNLKSGDVVFRMGTDITSYMMASVNDSGLPRYSHCGIASLEGGKWYVYHSIGGELNPDQAMVREPLAWYSSTSDALAVGIYRLQLDSATVQQMLRIVSSWYAIRLPFDNAFSLSTNDRMYCTEMVAKAISVAARSDQHFEPSRRGDFSFLSPGNLIASPILKPIYSYNRP